MTLPTFQCLDGHTCGMPVRLVTGGAPLFPAMDAAARRRSFLDRYDWIRTALMFEPRGHDAMSGAILYPPLSAEADAAILFIEVSGCLPMCGHGTIGAVTMAIERGLITPRTLGIVRLETPAGLVEARYAQADGRVESVTITNVPAFLFARDVVADCPRLGPLSVDVAYGGNFYAIVEPQPGYGDLAEMGASDLVAISPGFRDAINAAIDAVHPERPDIRGVSHVMWTGIPRHAGSHGRSAVFLGDRGIDRSPCGTGTSARMAQRHARGLLAEGDAYVHESIIGSRFTGRVVGTAGVGNHDAITPEITGWARLTGLNTITVDPTDPFAHGFLLP